MTFSQPYPILLAEYLTITYSYNGRVYSPVLREVKIFKINATQSETITYDCSLPFGQSIISDIIT